jgi:tRNA pseudouridine55 synthase
MGEKNYATGEVILVNKPYRWTSFDVVNFIRKILNVKIGHAGTLDPLATGLLILCTGSMTKKIDEYQAQEKEYTGTFLLGASTPSFDLETAVDKEITISHISDVSIYELVHTFIGTAQQEPPLFSAKKINGERAYEKARRGEDVIVKSREINISGFEITGIRRKENTIECDFKVVCSKGTYIRSLARDFALGLKTVGHLVALERTRIGEFKLEDAQTIEDFRKMFPLERVPKNKS